MKNKFNNWYSQQVIQQMDAVKKNVTDIEIKLLLSILKSLHAGWIVDFYNHMSTNKGKDIIMIGWKAVRILDALSKGKEIIQKSLDRFKDINDLVVDFELSDMNFKALCKIDHNDLQGQHGYNDADTDKEDDCDHWYLNDEDQIRNSFDVFDDEEDEDEKEN